MTGAKIAIVIVLIIVIVAIIGGLGYLYYTSSSSTMPAYQPPAYQQPTYQQPTYQQPAYQPPTYQQPTTSPSTSTPSTSTPTPIPVPSAIYKKQINGQWFDCTSLGDYVVESNASMQVCRKSDGSGNWGCPPKWSKLGSAPYCKYQDSDTINGKTFICPSGFNPETGSTMQVCRKSDGSGNWTCPSNWTKIGSAPYCS